MSAPIVTVKQGQLQGKTLVNIDGGNFYSFQGIRYANPPLGELRFKAPQPPEPWKGIRDATKEGNPCIARDLIFKTVAGSEDCLFLNVFTPQIPNENSNKLKPVMVWIHGGAFRYGSSSTDHYGPEYLLTEDIVLVTFNYRLGILGFLRFEDQALGVPGNAGMKDMVMALKWVQENISNFCGDPNNVTIFGESAGAAAVHGLVLSPLGKGLFHKAIAQSGCALNVFARGKDNISSELASALNRPKASEQEIFQHLKTMSVEELFKISEIVLELCGTLNRPADKRPYAPVVETKSENAFLNEDPAKILKSGNYNKVPMLFGFTSREGMLVEMLIKPRKPGMPRDFELIIPFNLGIEEGSQQSKSIANKIKDFYYGEPGSENDVDNFYKLHTDNYFLREIIFSTEQHVKNSSLPVYLYRMSIETSLNIFKKFGNIKAPGVAHGDDIGYLFKTKASPNLVPGSLEDVSVRRFVKFWTNFAKCGDPNSHGESSSVVWKPVEKDQINYMDIGEKLIAGVNPEMDRVKFWKEIFSINPLYNI